MLIILLSMEVATQFCLLKRGGALVTFLCENLCVGVCEILGNLEILCVEYRFFFTFSNIG